jgi:radical SAM superfamily enzyme YgiQ (UPF0313 family)
MKVLLVNNLHFNSLLDYEPQDTRDVLRVSTPPLGLLLLASVLTEQGHELDVVDFAGLARKGEIPTDAGFYPEAARYLFQRQADCVGFTTRCDDYHCILKIVEGFRELSPATPVVLGGPQATVTDQETLRLFPAVDFIVRNEAEETLPELLVAMNDGGDFAAVAGLSWRRRGEPVRNLDRPLIKDLDAYPMPAYGLYGHDFQGRWPVEVGRGCPFACTFCSTSVYFHRSFRLKSAARIAAEIRHLQEAFGARQFMFVHDMFTVNKRRVKEICRVLEETTPGVSWSCSARLDCIDDDLLDAMRRAGCDSIFIGIEAGSQRQQKLLNKHLDLTDLEPKIRSLKAKGYTLTTSFITGFDEETREDLEETLETLYRCMVAGVEVIQLHLWAPLIGSPLATANLPRLKFDGYLSDQVDPIFFSDEDVGLIKTHPEVFSAFYYVPSREVPRQLYHGLDFFGYASAFFPQTLYFLRRTSPLTLLDLFRGLKEWAREHRGVDFALSSQLSMIEFHQLYAEYLEHLIHTGALQYPYLLDILRFNVACTRFQHMRWDQQEVHANPVLSEDAMSGIPALAPGFEVHSFGCDIVRLIQIANAGESPRVEAGLSRPSSIMVTRVDSKLGVFALPILCKTLLDLCDGARPLGAALSILEARLEKSLPPEKARALAAGALDQLLRFGAVQITSPGENAGERIRTMNLPIEPRGPADLYEGITSRPC